MAKGNRTKYREVKIRAAVKLPALSTMDPERAHSFLAFLRQRVLGSKGMTKKENLPHYFEWEEKLDELEKRVAEEHGLNAPEMPDSVRLALPADAKDEHVKAAVEADFVANKEYGDAVRKYLEALGDAAAGECLYVTDEAFQAADTSAKEGIDEDMQVDPMGRSKLPQAWASKILRHYHAFSQSQAIEEHDIPVARPKPNGHVAATEAS